MDVQASNQTLVSYSNNTTNVEKLIVETLGPRQKDFVSAVLLTIVYAVIFITGMVGNLCTCLVIIKNHSMQTTTNYYLFSLAVSDLLLIFFGLPVELYSIWEAYPWRLGEAFCYLRQGMLESTSYASVLTITAFTVERYLAICHPLLAHKIAALSRAVKIIISIWIISVLVAMPYAIYTRTYYAVIDTETNTPVPNSLICNIPPPFLNGFMNYMFQVSTFLFFVGPVTIIIILYILIGIALHRSPLARGSSDERNYASMKCSSTASQQPRRVIIRMLVAVTVAFIFCWAPFHAQRLMTLYVPHWTPQLHLVQSHIFYISGVLYFVSSIVNPILYNVISKRYRAAFKQTICPCCYTRPHSANTSTATRQPERFSKAQAMVVLKNGNDSLRMVFRQEPSDPVMKDYETIPLNGTRKGPLLESEDLEIDHRVENSSSSESAEIQETFGVKKASYGAGIARKKGSYNVTCSREAPTSFIVNNRAAETELINPLQDNKTANALMKAGKPRKSYAHQVNGRTVMTRTPMACDYVSSNSSIVR